MAKGTNQKLKLFYLLQILYTETDEHHKIGMKEIIHELELRGVSAERKSVYDDIDLLRQVGFDIISCKDGKSFVYYMASRNFELAELKIITDLVESSKFITQTKTKIIVKKLQSLCSKHEGVQLERQVYSPQRIKNNNETIYYTVDTIHQAMTHDISITFKYITYNIKKEAVEKHNGKKYTVSPWQLVWDNENYYLVAYDNSSKIIKHFRVDKMRSVELLRNHKRIGSNEYNVHSYTLNNGKQFSMFSGEDKYVEIVFNKELIGVIIDRFGKGIAVQEIDQDHFLLRHRISVSNQFFGWLAGLSVKASDIRTDSVREQYIEILKDCLL